ncbi:hypothetical protein CU560_24495 [Serratia ureilytica]|nr:hypothetical protein CU560_24495 [Serratia ureilytica]
MALPFRRQGRLRELKRLPTASGAALGNEPDSVQMRYDAAGRLLGEQGVNGELQYQWDALANLQALTLPRAIACSGCITVPATPAPSNSTSRW